MEIANNKPSAADHGEGFSSTANVGNPSEKRRQSTLTDLTGEALPSVTPLAEGSEEGETLRRAEVLRDYLATHGSGTFEQAIAAAGLPPAPPPPMRAYVVNSHAPSMAMRMGWAVPSGGICRANAPQANGGRIGHYLAPQVRP